MFQAAVSQSLFLWLFFSSLSGCFSSVVDSFFGIVHGAFDDSTGIVDSSSSSVNGVASSFRRSVSSGVECFTSVVESFFRSSSSRINRFAGSFESSVSSWVSFFFWRASGESQRSSADDHDVLHCNNTPVVGQMTGKAHSTSRSLLKVHLSRSRFSPDR